MQTTIATFFKTNPKINDAEAILRKCVHCGFCSATCPSYQILGDELDSPRGRIYLIKQMLEGNEVSTHTLQHLDQCLTCRNCETTCPSGVNYGELIDIGRQELNALVKRPLGQTLQRKVLANLMLSPAFAPLFRLGQSMRPLLPSTLKEKVPEPQPRRALSLQKDHQRKVLMPKGCVQPAMRPTIDDAVVRVLDRLKIGVQFDSLTKCCGAVPYHLDQTEQALTLIRSNIDRWLELLETGQVECIINSASACGAMIKDYPMIMKHDTEYAAKAEKLIAYVKDVVEVVFPERQFLREQLAGFEAGNVAFHPPCTLQHWQGLRPMTEQLLRDLGLLLTAFNETHLCCGSAGAYSVLNPKVSKALRIRKLNHIEQTNPVVIISSNMGCINHLAAGTSTPVKHWIELVDEHLCAPE